MCYGVSGLASPTSASALDFIARMLSQFVDKVSTDVVAQRAGGAV
jgi:hypothetical protein